MGANALGDGLQAPLERNFVSTMDIIHNFEPYLEKIWELYLSLEEPTEETVKPYTDRKKLLTTWINGVIAQKNCTLTDIHEGFKDGLAIIHLIEVLSGTELVGYVPTPESFMECYKNISLALKFASTMKVDTNGITPDDIYHGRFHKSLILLVRIAQHWPNSFNEPPKVEVAETRRKSISGPSGHVSRRKSAGTPSHHNVKQSTTNKVEVKLTQAEQDQIYVLAIKQEQLKKEEDERKSKEGDARQEKKTYHTAQGPGENVFLVDMGAKGKEEIPYEQMKSLRQVLEELCKKHRIEMQGYSATTVEGEELFLDSFLGEIPKHICFQPVVSEVRTGTLDDLIKNSDVRTQKKLQQVTIPQRNYDEEDEDEMASRKRQLQRTNALDRFIDANVSNLALESLSREYQRMVNSLECTLKYLLSSPPSSLPSPPTYFFYLWECTLKYLSSLPLPSPLFSSPRLFCSTFPQ
eukprot:TRINITY_DN2257_c0_g2_i2.p1 TRINITY_DN2257_c0_g2~~TRINITY_DN2257_c0_g2_i2.p1  ORF type:complete len:465 (+),score=108.53 TRINITY_DN2257_c0_g2_i2:380-1774(+)